MGNHLEGRRKDAKNASVGAAWHRDTSPHASDKPAMKCKETMLCLPQQLRRMLGIDEQKRELTRHHSHTHTSGRFHARNRPLIPPQDDPVSGEIGMD
eukprot:761497-Rhodomonas_salina.2